MKTPRQRGLMLAVSEFEWRALVASGVVLDAGSLKRKTFPVDKLDNDELLSGISLLSARLRSLRKEARSRGVIK